MRARKCPGPGGSWVSIPYETAQPSVSEGDLPQPPLPHGQSDTTYPHCQLTERDTLLKASSRVFAHRRCSPINGGFLSSPATSQPVTRNEELPVSTSRFLPVYSGTGFPGGRDTLSTPFSNSDLSLLPIYTVIWGKISCEWGFLQLKKVKPLGSTGPSGCDSSAYRQSTQGAGLPAVEGECQHLAAWAGQPAEGARKRRAKEAKMETKG